MLAARGTKIRLALLLVLAALLLFLAVLHTPPARHLVRDRLAEYLRTSQGIEFNAGKLDYNLLTLSVWLERVSFSRTGAGGLPPFVRIESVQATLAPSSLFHLKPIIAGVRLSGIEVEIVRTETGKTNLPDSPEPDRPAGDPNAPLGFVIERLEASGRSIRVVDHQQRFEVHLPEWSLQIDGGTVAASHDIRFDARSAGAISFEGRSVRVSVLSMVANLRPGAFRLSEFRFRPENSEVQVSGTLDDFSNLRLNFQANADFDVGALSRFAGVSERIGGRLHSTSSVSGTGNELVVSSEIRGDNLFFRGLRNIALSANAEYSQGRQQISVKSLQVSAPAGSVTADGSLSLGRERSSLAASLRRLNLESILGQFDLPIGVAAIASGTAEAHWTGTDFQTADGRAMLSFSASRPRPGENILPVSGNLGVTVRDNRLQVDIAGLDALGTHVEGRAGLLAMKRLDGELRASVDSIAQSILELEAFLGREPGTLAGVPLGGSIEAKASLAGTTAKPEISSSLVAPSTTIGLLEDVGISVDFGYSPELAALRDLNVSWQGQNFHASGEIALRGESPSLDLTAQLRRGSIPAVLAGMGRQIPVEGAFSMNANVRGTVANPAADLSLNASGLRAYGENLGELAVEAGLHGKRLELARFQLEKPQQDGADGILTATGTFNLETRAYSLESSGENIRLTNLNLPGETPLRARLNLAVKGQGTPDDPSLTAALGVEDLRVRDFEAGDLNLAAEVGKRQAKVTAQAPRFRLAADALVGIQPPYPTEFEVSSDATDLSRLSAAVAGSLSAAIKGSGNLEQWEAGQLSATIRDLVVKMRGEELRNEGPLQFRYADRTLEAETATLTAAGSRLSIAGKLPLEPAEVSEPLRLRSAIELGGLLALIPETPNFTLEGQANIDAVVRGSLKQIDPSATLTVRDAALVHPQLGGPVSDIGLTLQYKNGVASLERLTARLGDGSVEATGELPLRTLGAALPVVMPENQGPAKFSLNLKNVGLKSLFDAPESISGTVGLTLEAEAPRIADVKTVRAGLRFDDLSVKIADYELSQDGQSELSLRDGTVHVDRFRMAGPATRLEVVGNAVLAGEQPVDIRASGNLDISVFTLLTGDFKARGPSEFALALSGRLSAPQLFGYFEVKDGQASLRTPQVAAQDLNLRIDVTPERFTIQRFTGSLNGGTLKASGSAGYRGTQLKDVDISIAAKESYLDFPKGLRSQFDADLKFRSQDDFFVLGGRIDVLQGIYRRNLEIGGEVLNYLKAGGGTVLLEERNPFLSKLRFNVAVSTRNPIVVDNNLAKLALNADARLVGGFYRPGLTGRLVLEENGKLYFSERTFFVDRGVITFVSETKIEPDLDILARTKVASHDISLQLSGTPDDFSADLTSDSSLSQPNIVSLLMTGRKLEDLEGSGLNVAREQAASFVSGRLGGFVSSGAKEALGLSQVRIDPSFINAEEDPSARLTLGQDLTNRLQFIYSMNLLNGGDQIYIVRQNVTRRFETEATRQSDNSYRFDLRHDLQFGGGPEAGVPTRSVSQQERIADIEFTGSPVFPPRTLSGALDLEPGDRYDFFKLQKGVDRLRRFYEKRSYLEATVDTERQPAEQNEVQLRVRIEAGPKVEFVYEGRTVSDGVKKQVRNVWREGLFDSQRLQEAELAIRSFLVDNHYVSNKVSATVRNGAPDEKRVIFEIDSGPRFEDVKLVFPGAGHVGAEPLNRLLQEEHLLAAVYLEPSKVRDFLNRYYRQEGFLEAKAGEIGYELDRESRSGTVTIPIEEGPQFRLGKLEFRGNQAFTEKELDGAMELSPGAFFRPATLQDAVSQVEEFYWKHGYSDVVVNQTASRASEPGAVDVSFQITENKQSVVTDIEVEGNRGTSRNLVRTQLALSEGDVFDYQKANQSRRRLYDTRAYTLVEVQPEPADAPVSAFAKHQKPVRLKVNLKEVKPFALRYGVFFDTERGPGIIADFSNQNSLGSARRAGMRTRYDSDVRELRGYLTQPFLRRFPIQTNVVGFIRREIEPSFITDRTGLTLQQEALLGDQLILTYGYRFERTHTFDKDPDSLFQIPPFHTAPLTTSLTRDTRDEVLDATKGSFLSQAFQFAPSFLGSDIRFVKFFGQYFHYLPLSKPAEVPFGGRRARSRWIYAGAARIGLAEGLGPQDLIRTEKFFLGGGTTLRGFEQDGIGPVDFLGDPAGGNALFLINNELRFPLFSIFEGVGFLDLGNVYPAIGDFNLSDVRKSSGFGLRVRTPYFLLRADYGIKLDRKPGESFGKFFFSIGQAF